MDIEAFAAQMENNAATIKQLLTGVSDEQAKWKPDDDTWSILEVINHLYDEEQFDFRVRMDHILHQPGVDPPPIDPSGWVIARRYNEREFQSSLDNFLQEREKSLAWLRRLDSPDWEAAYTASWGSIRAGDMFGAWVAHDFLHLRQLVELLYRWNKEQVQPYKVNYAGEW